jgi:hypothetical protein
LKALPTRQTRSLLRLQQWQRSQDEARFHLTQVDPASLTDESDKPFTSLPQETRLQDLTAPVSPAVLRVLPRCLSLRSLDASIPSNSDVDITSLSSFLLETPSLHSLSLSSHHSFDISSLPLSKLKSFKSYGSSAKSVSEALINSKPKSLTHLDLSNFSGSFEPLASALLECPSLSNLTLHESQRFDRNILPVFQVLPRLPLLTALTLDPLGFSNDLIQFLLSFLSQSAVQDLKLGTLSFKQLLLIAHTLPSLSSLVSLEVDTSGSQVCEHDSSYLALFSALTSSSLRTLTLSGSSLRRAAFESCLSKVPESQLTKLLWLCPTVYEDPPDDPDSVDSFETVVVDSIAWSDRFPQIKDRFCLIMEL